LTVLNIEAGKVRRQMEDSKGHICREWRHLGEAVKSGAYLKGKDLDQAIWNLGIVLGRTFHETLATPEDFDESVESTRAPW
jgi:hypothetical protein